MRNKRVEEIKKRIAKRKAEQEKREEDKLFSFEEQEYTPLFAEEGEEAHPLFRKEIFLFKLLLSAILVLVVAILFKNTTNSFEGARTVVKQTMKEEFQFAFVSKWYESQFGKPLSFFPSSEKKTTQKEKNYAVPASGKVMQSFQANGQGVFVQTATNAVVESVNEGIVVSIDQKEEFGNTVEIQHADGTESWYGNLGETSVKLYDYVAKKQKVGTVANGKFYFAFKKNEKFIDPIQVISFE
ncbi:MULTISPECIES: M23 family metallopeptidase [unclassified Bacillus (in: firmicutes)]|uniref:M23 family metallopeptidase n=1 Tax=unclassified Bacillus (in: firmicutes) TaxID=185979 RepID=UPI0008ED7E55|nr:MULTISPECIES: M23 family metallopeptidase [unclassified Bacillus (in: firmicutes)]SFJ82426.1 stage IV sporulation protein FA [Bacillus sp. 71mf]SFS53013.1 stage IV sporulation protein FA [Bacillus sp. 103mf]